MHSTDKQETAPAVSTDIEAEVAKIAVRTTVVETVPAEMPPAGEMSLADALEFAVRSHRNGAIDNAEKVYRRILEVVPEHPDALNFLAMIEVNRGKLQVALELMQRSIAADPEQGERYNNLGNMLLAAGRTDEAIKAYEHAIERCPDSAVGYHNLGIMYRNRERLDDAARAYQRALQLDHSNVDAWNNYGNLQVARGELQSAVKCFSKAIILNPSSRTTKRQLATAHSLLGELDTAADIYREILDEHPDDPAAKHLLAAVTGSGVPDRATDEFIVGAFDGFAATFDQKLASLDYRAPELVLDAVIKAGFEPHRSVVVLDAGCGTGLCGPLLAPYAATLHGVDLSGGMLARARERSVYDELTQAELTDFLRHRTAEYDLIVSADTLCYFGALEDVINAAAGALRQAGWFVFTVEHAEQAEAPAGHQLHPHGRYSHSRDYVERTLAAAAALHAKTSLSTC